ncbi:MAG: hydrolase, partial [Desulfosalsimonas sp.]
MDSTNQETEHKLQLRNLTAADYQDVKEIMDLVYPDKMGAWDKNEFHTLITRFPEGQICVEDKGKVVAAALSIIVNSE